MGEPISTGALVASIFGGIGAGALLSGLFGGGGGPEMPEMPPFPSFPELPKEPNEAQTPEEREAENRRRIAARRTGGNPNVLTTPLGVTEAAPVAKPMVLGK